MEKNLSVVAQVIEGVEKRASRKKESVSVILSHTFGLMGVV